MERLLKGDNKMTDKEFEEYLSAKPTVKGIITEMKSWWSNSGSDEIIQKAFDKILEITGETE